MIDGIRPGAPDIIALRGHINRRIEDLRTQLEHGGADATRDNKIRGRIAELRDLLQDVSFPNTLTNHENSEDGLPLY